MEGSRPPVRSPLILYVHFHSSCPSQISLVQHVLSQNQILGPMEESIVLFSLNPQTGAVWKEMVLCIYILLVLFGKG